jgi:hypothetical protein
MGNLKTTPPYPPLKSSPGWLTVMFLSGSKMCSSPSILKPTFLLKKRVMLKIEP